MLVYFMLLDRGYKHIETCQIGAPPGQNTTVVLPSRKNGPAWAEYRVKEVITQYSGGNSSNERAFVIVVKQKDATEATRRIDALASDANAKEALR